MRTHEEFCSEIARNGFKKIMLVNAHGGNISMLDGFINKTLKTKKDYAVVYRNAYDYGVADILRDYDSGVEFPALTVEDIELIRDFVDNEKMGGHADFEETAAMLAVAPALVKLDRMYAESGLPTHLTDDYAKWGLACATRFWYLEYPNHYAGHHPEGVNERIGQVLLSKRIERQIGAVHLMKQDDRLLEWNREWYEKWL